MHHKAQASQMFIDLAFSVGGTNDITDKSSPTFFVERIIRQKYNSVNKVGPKLCFFRPHFGLKNNVGLLSPHVFLYLRNHLILDLKNIYVFKSLCIVYSNLNF